MFSLNKSHGKYRRLLSKTLKNITHPKLLNGCILNITEGKRAVNVITLKASAVKDCLHVIADCVSLFLSISLRTVKMTLKGLTPTMNHLTGGILSIVVSLSPTSTASFILKVNSLPTLLSTPLLYYVCLITCLQDSVIKFTSLFLKVT